MTNSIMTDIDLPKYSKTAGTMKKFSPMIYLKPNNPGEFYRFRLLKIDSEVGRDYPFIERYIHDHWAMTDKGYKLPDDSVTCLRTGYVDYPAKQKKTDCPMCNHANEQWSTLQSSGFHDPIAREKFNSMKSKYEKIIPVYVVRDPNNPKNEGRCKTFMFTKNKRGKNDPVEELCAEDFEKIIRDEILKAKASAQNGNPYTIWNSKCAVDLCIQITEKEIIAHPGEANQYTYRPKIISKIWFTKTPYDIDAITEEAKKNLDFDQFYTSSTPQEIEAFYRKYYSSAANIPEEVVEIPDDLPVPKTESVGNVANPTKPVIPPMDIDGVDLDLGIDTHTEKSTESTVQNDDPVGFDVDKDFESIVGDL